MDRKAAVLIDNQHLKKQVIDQMSVYGEKFLLEYEAFSTFLCDDIRAEMFRTYIYDCEMKSNERLLSSLNKIDGFQVRKGVIQHSDRGYRQKQVDILIALDMIKLSMKNRIDDIILVTGDGDFVPVIEFVKGESVKVHVRSGSSYNKELREAADNFKKIPDEYVVGLGSNWEKTRKKLFGK